MTPERARERAWEHLRPVPRDEPGGGTVAGFDALGPSWPAHRPFRRAATRPRRAPTAVTSGPATRHGTGFGHHRAEHSKAIDIDDTCPALAVRED